MHFKKIADTTFKDTLNDFDDFKSKQNSVWRYGF